MKMTAFMSSFLLVFLDDPFSRLHVIDNITSMIRTGSTANMATKLEMTCSLIRRLEWSLPSGNAR